MAALAAYSIVATDLKVVQDRLNLWLFPILKPITKMPETWMLAGGAIRDIVRNERPEDLDFFVRPEDRNQAVGAFEFDGWRVYERNGKVTKLVKDQLTPVHIIEFDKPNPEGYHKFDFTVCQAGFVSDSKIGPPVLVFTDLFWEDIHDKRLRLNPIGVPNPLSTLRRVTKLWKKGWVPAAEIFEQLAEAIKGQPIEELRAAQMDDYSELDEPPESTSIEWIDPGPDEYDPFADE